MKSRSLLAIALALSPIVAFAADPRREGLLSDYVVEAKRLEAGFISFSAQRGEVFFRASWKGGDARTPSCMACHTANPRQAGLNAKTGRPIEPVAVSANPRRFTDKVEVEKHFLRDCKSVLGRECTALEKGDYITFMAGQ
jgi:hypothetical protein